MVMEATGRLRFLPQSQSRRWSGSQGRRRRWRGGGGAAERSRDGEVRLRVWRTCELARQMKGNLGFRQFFFFSGKQKTDFVLGFHFTFSPFRFILFLAIKIHVQLFYKKYSI
jgi:hypothetical protein